MNVLGSTIVSWPIVTSASMIVLSGSTIVTPLRPCASWMRCWASLRTFASSTRSLTPSVSVGSVTTWPWTVLPASISFGSTSGR